MKKLLNRLSEIIEISYASRSLNFDKPAIEKDFIELKEMYERNSK